MPICSVSGSGSRSADWVLSSLWSHHIRSMPASLHDSWMVHNVVCCKSLHETHKLSIVWSLSPEVCQLSPNGCGIKSVNLTFREKLIQPVTEMQPTLLTQLATTAFHFLCYWLMFHKTGYILQCLDLGRQPGYMGFRGHPFCCLAGFSPSLCIAVSLWLKFPVSRTIHIQSSHRVAYNFITYF